MTVAKAERLDEQAEKVRARIGLTTQQWKTLAVRYPDPEVITTLYQTWVLKLRKDIKAELSRAHYDIEGKPYLSAVQVARVLGIGEFHVCNLLHRGRLEGTRNGRRVGYAYRDVASLAERDYAKEGFKRSPLGRSFLDWALSQPNGE